MTGIILPWPRRLTWLFVAALIAVASALALAGVFGWGPTQWTSLTSSMREGVLLPGVVATVAGAWVGRSFSRNSVVAGPSASRVCLAASRQAVLLLAFVSLGYVVGAIPAVFWTASRAEAGRFDVLSFAATTLALCAMVAVSFLVAVVLGNRWSLIAGPAVSLIVAVLPAILNPMFGSSGRSTRQASIVWLNDFPFPGWSITTQTSVFRILLFVLVVAGSVLVVSALVQRLRDRRLWAGVAAWAVVSVMVGASVALSPNLVTRDENELVCTEVGGLEVCLLPEYRSLAAQVVSVAQEALEVAGSRDQPLILVQTSAEPGPEQEGTATFSLLSVDSPRELRARVGSAVADALSGGQACSTRLIEAGMPADLPETLAISLDLQRSLASAIESRVGIQTTAEQVEEDTGTNLAVDPSGVFVSMGDDELRIWMATHTGQIRDCTLTVEDIG